MHQSLVLPCLLSIGYLAIAAAFPPTLEHTIVSKRQTPSNSCATGVHIIVGPGWTGDPTNYGGMGDLVDRIEAAIPGSNSFCLGPFPHPGKDFVQSTQAIGKQARQYIADYHFYCPYSKLVMVGTSAGAVTIFNVLCGGSPSPPWHASPSLYSEGYPFVAAIMYGPETYAAGQPYNAGTCKKNAPNGHRTTAAACAPFYPYIQSYCDKADPECCTGGTNYSAHLAYPSIYDVKAADFVVEAYEASLKPKDRHLPN